MVYTDYSGSDLQNIQYTIHQIFKRIKLAYHYTLIF